MVQVDVFWGYAFGASLALASGRREARRRPLFESRHFTQAVLFLALVWAPTGLLLLLRHPSWETMQAAGSLAGIPPFVTLAFGLTNVTQGIVGFWVGRELTGRGQEYLANLNWMAGYFGMFFILVYGWDGLGYDRFFYDRDMLPGSPMWTPGAGTGGSALGTLGAAGRFLASSVAVTLYIDGVFLLPTFFYLFSRWFRASQIEAGDSPTSPKTLVLTYLSAVFTVGLGAAVFCAWVVNYLGAVMGVGDHVARGLGHIPARSGWHVLSYVVGLPLSLVLLWFGLVRPGRVVSRMIAPLCPRDGSSTDSRSPVMREALGGLP